MKKLMVLFFVVMMTMAVSVFAQSKTKTVVEAPKPVSPKPMEALPWWGDPAYPVIHDSKPMDALQIMAFGLRPAVLAEDWVALNWYSKESRFKLETLPVGTVVLVDQFGRTQYKLECSNRLVSPTDGAVRWPRTTMVLPTTGPTMALPTTSLRRLDSWLSRMFNRLVGAFD